jgi:hypothetical protein
MSNQNIINDPYAMAEDPQELKYTNEYYGEVGLDVWFCVLEKGYGKVPFDSNQHSIDRRLTAITMGVVPVPASGLQFSVDRDYIAEFRDWNAITLPSLKKLGVSLRELDGKFAHVKLTETGETYTNRNGETKEKTVFEFLAMYETLEECEAAYEAAFGGSKKAKQDIPFVDKPYKKDADNGDKEKEAAVKFLEVAVKSTCKGMTELAEAREAVADQIAKMPMINKYFTIDSPETMNFMAEVLG